MNRSKRMAIIVILASNAIIISLIESLIPIPSPVPGVKLGLGNIITLVAIVFLNLKDAFLIVLLRCFVVAILSRGILMLALSLSGGLLSLGMMWFFYKRFSSYFSIKGISVIGAISHNSAQLVVASLILRERLVLYYLPVLLVSALITGLITGIIGEMVIKELKRKQVLSDTHDISNYNKNE